MNIRRQSLAPIFDLSRHLLNVPLHVFQRVADIILPIHDEGRVEIYELKKSHTQEDEKIIRNIMRDREI